VVYADGMLYTYEGPKKGVVSLVKASPEGFERTGSFVVAKGRDKHWAHPTIAGGRLYIRYGGALYAYDIAAK
jgi:outer membrane protein assembly factor BamB